MTKRTKQLSPSRKERNRKKELENAALELLDFYEGMLPVNTYDFFKTKLYSQEEIKIIESHASRLL